MFLSHRSAIILSIAVTSGWLSISCTDNRISECNQIVNVANQTVTEAKGITPKSLVSNPEAMLKVANAMDKAAQLMEALEIRDAQIKTYQVGLVGMYRDTSKATKDFVGAFKQRNRPAAETALRSLKQATVNEPELVAGIKNYCKP